MYVITVNEVPHYPICDTYSLSQINESAACQFSVNFAPVPQLIQIGYIWHKYNTWWKLLAIAMFRFTRLQKQCHVVHSNISIYYYITLKIAIHSNTLQMVGANATQWWHKIGYPESKNLSSMCSLQVYQISVNFILKHFIIYNGSTNTMSRHFVPFIYKSSFVRMSIFSYTQHVLRLSSNFIQK